MSNGRTVGRGALWSILNSGMSQFLALAVFFVTARFVSPSDFGVMAVCMLVVELFKQVGVESFATWVMAKAKPSNDDYDACFGAILAVSALSALGCIGLAGTLAAFLGNPEIAGALRLLSVLLLTAGLSRTHEAWLLRGMQFRVLAIRSIVSIVAGGGVGVWLAVNGYGLVSLIAQQIVTALIGTAALWAVSGWKPRLHTRPETYREAARYARFVALTGLTNFANTQSDTFFSSYYLGAAATGVYSAAKRILLGINLVLATALSRVALPAFANLRGDPAAMSSAFLRAVSFTSTITAPVFAGLIVTAPDITALLMTGKWAEVGPVISIMAITGYLTTLGQYNQAILLVSDKPHWQTALTSIYALSNICLFFVVVRYGLLALAIGYSVRAVLLYPLSVGGALHLLKIDVGSYVGRFLPTLLSAVVMAGAVLLALSQMPAASTVVRLLVSVLLGAAVYTLATAVIARRDLKEFMGFARRLA